MSAVDYEKLAAYEKHFFVIVHNFLISFLMGSIHHVNNSLKKDTQLSFRVAIYESWKIWQKFGKGRSFKNLFKSNLIGLNAKLQISKFGLLGEVILFHLKIW